MHASKRKCTREAGRRRAPHTAPEQACRRRDHTPSHSVTPRPGSTDLLRLLEDATHTPCVPRATLAPPPSRTHSQSTGSRSFHQTFASSSHFRAACAACIVTSAVVARCCARHRSVKGGRGRGGRGERQVEGAHCVQLVFQEIRARGSLLRVAVGGTRHALNSSCQNRVQVLVSVTGWGLWEGWLLLPGCGCVGGMGATSGKGVGRHRRRLASGPSRSLHLRLWSGSE